jgi:Predicted O-linked N-acetylglucosamine transferase, SPINDLY family
LGYPGTTGSNYIDYIIADKKLISDERQKYFSEKVIYLPDTYQANDSKKKISNIAFAREEFNLPKNSFVFCCFNKAQKITPNVFDIWMKILNRVDKSVLWLLEDNKVSSENLKKEAAKRNINPGRIIFAKKTMLSDHLARHKLADLFLDTFIVGAHTTCSDSLWSGLPILTKTGSSLASNVSSSLLSAIGLNELVTNNESDYENLAVELANNPEKINNIKNKLLKNRLEKPLFNTKLFTKNIENAYKAIYERYVKNLAR